MGLFPPLQLSNENTAYIQSRKARDLQKIENKIYKNRNAKPRIPATLNQHQNSYAEN